ncbi:MAG: DUF72 domain-containing protein [Chloroflexota bacterium]
MELGPVLHVGRAEVRVGTSSWTDRTLVEETDWYPRRRMRAAERLAYYASRFPIVEVDATFYFPPSPELAAAWVARTPPGFRMDVKAWSLFTGHGTLPESLWPDLQSGIRPEMRDRPRLYASHLEPAAVEECWARFHHALGPLHRGGRLGAVGVGDRCIAEAAERMRPYRIYVELRNARWFAPGELERTLSFLEEHSITFTCVDEPQGFASSVPPVVAATSNLGVVRMHGRNAATWEARVASAAERFAYHYSEEELAEWVPRVHALAASATEVHVLFNNCYRDYAVDNATTFIRMLAAG